MPETPPTRGPAKMGSAATNEETESKMIRLVQCLCPARHCLMAVAYEPEDEGCTPTQAMDALRMVFEKAVRENIFNPWCGLCGSRELKYEDAISIYKTMDEARPALEQMEREQAFTRQAFASRRNTN